MAHPVTYSTITFQDLLARLRYRGAVCPVSGQTPAEEWANVVTHGLGWLLSIAGVAILIVLASRYGSPWHIVGCSIYGATLILVYAASTVYHSSRNMALKRWLRDVDQAVILVFIAGTYTAFTLGPLNGGWGWSLFGVAWGLAALGIGLKAGGSSHFKRVAIPLYLGLGWLCIVGTVPLLESLSLVAILLLAGGGAAYSLGTVFFIKRKMLFHHTLWHLAVILGSAFHYFAILFYVVPLA